ncbi:hypothetical protein BDU57DRAFT_569906, partial [Ampelomyces quisqualis]
ECVHVLVQHDLHGGAVAHVENVTHTKRRTIFALPDGIRNTIYGYILAIDDPVVALYDPPLKQHPFPDSWLLTDPFHPGPKPKVSGQPEAITQLRNMSWASRKLREEIRGFFFAHQLFHVVGYKSSTHTNFLYNINSVGRINVTMLNLSGARSHPCRTRFVNVLLEGISLRSLTMRRHVD